VQLLTLHLFTHVFHVQVDGQLILLGIPWPQDPFQFGAFSVILPRRIIRGSFIGGIAMTQKMLDFCKEKNIRSMVEVIEASDVNAAYDRIIAADHDVKFRFVIDVQKSIID
jgi:alcohol dehydrogenase (NADP+)